MKKIFGFFVTALCLVGLASCETYKVDEPDMTAVNKVDGSYVCFAYDVNGTEPRTICYVEITNTTNDEPDRIWMTVTDVDPSASSYYLSAYRFDLQYDAATNSFNCTDRDCKAPRTCYNPWLEQHFYTAEYIAGLDLTYSVTASGSVTVDGVSTKSGYKTDGIEATITFKLAPIGEIGTLVLKGMKNTGWAEDLEDFQDFIDENWSEFL